MRSYVTVLSKQTSSPWKQNVCVCVCLFTTNLFEDLGSACGDLLF